MKKVLLISLASRFGGGETYLEQLAPILRNRVHLYVFCIHHEVKTRMQSLGIEALCVKLAETRAEIFRIPAGLLGLLYFRLIKGVKHVVLNGYAPAALALPARILGFRIYLIAHLNLTQRVTFTQRLFLHRRYLTSLRFVDRVICVSEPVAAELRAIFPLKDIVAIPNWIADVPPLNHRTHDAGELLKLLYVGRLVELKGLPLLLEALRRIPGLSLTVVGEGSLRKELEQMAEGLDVVFAGFQRATSHFFEDADLFVNPSLGPEGLPMVSLEAMAHSLPCIFSDLPIHAEISQDGRAALLFKRGSVESLAERIAELVADPILRGGYAERAHRAIVEYYSAPTATGKYLRALEVE
jgi:glycosyltransferase involved in cell wall biosynthesis